MNFVSGFGLIHQVNPHSSPSFSFSRAIAIVHRDHFFRLYQKDKSSDSKVKFRQDINYWKGVLEATKLAYANKRDHYFPETWLS